MEDLRAEILRYVGDPPRFEPPADIIAPRWSRLAYETARAMDWTHMLHSQLYDILSDDSIVDKKPAGEAAIAYYLARSDAAFSTRGYGHRWMEAGGPWAGNFRERFPAINGILWAYHWHHAAIYEALMEPDRGRRAAAVTEVLRTFADSLLVYPPQQMPLTAEIAPRFSAVFPAAAHIFDNLHMMHDVANDIMADTRLGIEEKHLEIQRLLENMRYSDQAAVVAPALPMSGDHAAHRTRVPTRTADGTWLPQGHPAARLASMEELMRPLPAIAHP